MTATLIETQLPDWVRGYLRRLFLRRARPSFLCIEDSGTVCGRGGDLTEYGLDGVQSGDSVLEVLPLLDGLFPAAEPLVLPWIQTPAGLFMDVHVISESECTRTRRTWVLFLRSVLDAEQRASMQQIGNELTLQRDRQTRILDSYVGHEVAQRLLQNGPQAQAHPGTAERRTATILFCDLRGFTPFSEQHPPEVVFATLNEYLNQMIAPILAAGGLLDKIAGDAAMAVFGLPEWSGLHAHAQAHEQLHGTLPPPPSPDATLPVAAQAVQTARAILRGIAQLNAQRVARGLEALGVGAGVTTGPVAVGSLGTSARRSFAVIGHSVNLAARLQGSALAGEILIDTATHAALGELGTLFRREERTLRGLSVPTPTYSLREDG